MHNLLSKTCLSVTALFAVGFISANAEAHRVSHYHNYYSQWPIDSWENQTVTPFCGGKYEIVAKELNRDNSMGAVNLYRLKAGLPFLQYNGIDRRQRVYGASTNRETRLRDAQLLLERRQNHLSVEAERDYLQSLEYVTAAGRRFDWWLTPEALEVAEGQTNAAMIARSSTGFDWLMTDHQMQSVRLFWNNTGVIRQDETDAIFDHIDGRAIERPGINIWMAHYQHHKALFPETERTLPTEISERAQAAVSDILTCQASPADYGIIAKGDLGLPHDYLPRVLADKRARRDIHKLTVDALTNGNGLDLNYPNEVLRLSDRLEHKHWAEGFLLLSAPDLQTAHQYAEGQSHHNLFFSLPARDIPENYKSMALSHALTEGEFTYGLTLIDDVLQQKRDVLEMEVQKAQTRFDRSQDRSAYYLNHVKAVLDRAKTKLEAFNTLNPSTPGSNGVQLPAEMQLALTALFAGTSHNINPHHRDVFPVQSDERFLNTYLQRRLFPGARFYAQSRAKSLQSLRKNDGTFEIGFAALVDWEKLEGLQDEKRLTRTIALTVFDWLDQATPAQRRQHADLLSQALYDIIRMCRHEDAGELGGAPIQKRAFERLHKYYGNSDQARRTKYWWASRGRHGNLPL